MVHNLCPLIVYHPSLDALTPIPTLNPLFWLSENRLKNPHPLVYEFETYKKKF